MKNRYFCEIVRTCDNVWYLDDDGCYWQSLSKDKILKLISEKLSEIIDECEKERALGSLFVDIDFHRYKPLKK